jgi:hypothetical protein
VFKNKAIHLHAEFKKQATKRITNGTINLWHQPHWLQCLQGGKKRERERERG